MELLTLKSMLLLFGEGLTCIIWMKWRGRWYFIKPWKKNFPTYSVLEKSAYHLIVAISVELPTLIISRVSTCSCTISWTTSWDCKPITIHFSQYSRFYSSSILRETWRETFPVCSLTFCENTDCLAKTAKCEMRKMIGEMVYKMPSIH